MTELEAWEERLCEERGIKPCYVQLKQMPKRRIAELLRILAQQMEAETQQEEEQEEEEQNRVEDQVDEKAEPGEDDVVRVEVRMDGGQDHDDDNDVPVLTKTKPESKGRSKRGTGRRTTSKKKTSKSGKSRRQQKRQPVTSSSSAGEEEEDADDDEDQDEDSGSFPDYPVAQYDKFPKSSPESFTSEPLNSIQQQQQPPHRPTHTPTCKSDPGKENDVMSNTTIASPSKRTKSPTKSSSTTSSSSSSSQPQERQQPVLLNTVSEFIVNRPPVTSPSYDKYFMQKYDISDSIVELDRLDVDFIHQAKQGLVKWKAYFKNPTLELARLAAAQEPDVEPEYVVEQVNDEDFVVDGDEEFDDEDLSSEGEDDGSDFEKELLTITRSQEATLRSDEAPLDTSLSPRKQREKRKRDSGSKPTTSKKRRKSKDSDFEVEGTSETTGTTGTKKRVRNRVTARHKVVLHRCSDCNFSSSCLKDLKLHAAKHGIGLEPISCPDCGFKSFSTFDDERHQYEAHEGPDKLPRTVTLFCKSCDQMFEGQQEFGHHIVNHVAPIVSGYACNFDKCSFSSAKYETVKDHVSCHTLFKCTFCDKTMNKLDLLERHSSQEHKDKGRPFDCGLCPFRSAVFGLLVRHKEEAHAILTDKDSDSCRFCAVTGVGHVFLHQDDLVEHLALHAEFEPAFRCKECPFTAPRVSMFHDHNFQNHISTVLSEEVSWEADVPGLLDKLSQMIKKKFKKVTERKKPNVQETDFAVQALQAALHDGGGVEFTDSESRSFVSGDLELDASILTSGELAGGCGSSLNSGPATSGLEDEHLTNGVNCDDDEDGENVIPMTRSERPKRRSALEAVSRLQRQKAEEDEERRRKERRRAQQFQRSTSSQDSGAAIEAMDADFLPTTSDHVNNAIPASSQILHPHDSLPTPATSSHSFSSSDDNSSPSKGQPDIESLIRSVDLQENNAIPEEVINDVFMDPAAGAAGDSVSPFVYDAVTGHIMYQGYPVLDAASVPVTCTPEQLPEMLNLLYTQSGLL